MRDEPALFRRFADLPIDSERSGKTYQLQPSTIEAWVNFADQYGLLTVAVWSSEDRESVSLWLENVSKLRFAIELEELLREHPRRLSRIVKSRLSKHSFRVHPPFDGAEFLETEVFSSEKGHIRTASEAVRFAIARTIQTQLGAHPVSLHIAWNQHASRFEMRPVPSSLLSAIWYQAAATFTGDTAPLERCDVCGQWMMPTRVGHKFCSAACKQMAYRRRQRKMR